MWEANTGNRTKQEGLLTQGMTGARMHSLLRSSKQGTATPPVRVTSQGILEGRNGLTHWHSLTCLPRIRIVDHSGPPPLAVRPAVVAVGSRDESRDV